MSSMRKKFTIFVAGIAAVLAVGLPPAAADLAKSASVTSGSTVPHLDDTGWS
ncbi:MULTISPECIES: hypothetical protein [unclassified Streptomyces]|uniref:hypothetical protein n=1 Tax=unclassified Streptomyces TaxID=2593676 RepID=UPI000AE9E884|nr:MULTISPECIES: hypothetical protein [unclassified Streptomyces]